MPNAGLRGYAAIPLLLVQKLCKRRLGVCAVDNTRLQGDRGCCAEFRVTATPAAQRAAYRSDPDPCREARASPRQKLRGILRRSTAHAESGNLFCSYTELSAQRRFSQRFIPSIIRACGSGLEEGELSVCEANPYTAQENRTRR